MVFLTCGTASVLESLDRFELNGHFFNLISAEKVSCEMTVSLSDNLEEYACFKYK